MDGGSIRLELDELPSPEKYFDFLRSVGIEPMGYRIDGDAGIKLFYPKVQGAAPIKQQVRPATLMLYPQSTKPAGSGNGTGVG